MAIIGQVFFLTDVGKLIVAFIWKHTDPRIAKTVAKKYKVGGITLFTIKVYYIAVLIKTVCYQQKDRHIDNRTE